MKIQNIDELAVTEARTKALAIAEAGLEAIDTERVLKNLVSIDGATLTIDGETFPLNSDGRIFFFGIGKCAVEAAKVFEALLGEELSGGVVIDIKDGGDLKKLKWFKGSHPLPSQENIKASRYMVETLESLTKKDLAVFLVSGGGSSLLCLPENENYEADAEVAKKLMAAGATIQETNIVRKHFSLARGGWLAKYAHPAKVVSLIFSDVPGNSIESIASGPTCKDDTTIEDAKKVLVKYTIEAPQGLIETPKEETYFKNVKNILALSNQTALDAMAKKAEELDLAPRIVTNHFSGQADDVGKKMAEDLRGAEKNAVLLYGGETTVAMRGTGRGGRNLELGLSALEHLQDGELLITVASDGKDNGSFGGAVCDEVTKKAIIDANLSAKEFLDNNNTYPLFEKIGNYLLMGDTGSNVSDLVIAIKR